MGLTVTAFNPGLTPGSVAFQGASGLSQDNANFFYDSTNHRLGLGTTTPRYVLDVNGSINASGGSQNSGPRNTGLSVGGGQFVVTNIGNSSNLFIGDVVGANTTGSVGYYNTIIGLGAGANIPDVSAGGGNTNTIVGHFAAVALTTGSGNAIFGANAGAALTTGNHNNIFGPAAGLALVSGDNNTFIGFNAGALQTSGSNNILIGAGNAASTTGSSQLNIGNAIYGNLSTGNIGIGSTSPAALLAIQGTAGFATTLFAVASSTGTQLFTVLPNGNVGIGTNNPSAPIQVQSGANFVQLDPSNAKIRIFSSGVLDGQITASTTMTIGAQNGFAFNSSVNVSGVLGSTGELVSGVTGATGAGGTLTLRPAAGNAPYISFVESGVGFRGTLGYAAASADLVYQSGGTGALGSGTERFRITSAGNVGIGTTSPTGRLDAISADNSNGTNIITAYANNLSQGQSLRYDGLHAVGTNATVDVNIVAQGSGNVILTPSGTGQVIFTSGLNMLTSGASGNVYGYGNSINGQYGTNANGILYINLDSYQNGPTQFRDTEIANGKGANVAFFQGSTGNVGIGTTSPTSTLFVQGTGATNPFTIASSTGTQLLTVLPNGNVGIGIMAPSYALDVRNNSVDNIGWGGTDAARGVVSWASGTARVFATSGNTLSLGANGTTNYVTINTTGNVGIGTTNPTSLLYLSSSGNTIATIDASLEAGLKFTKANSLKWELYSPSGSNDFRFYDGTADRMTIQNGGNVGIGTTTPTALLSFASSTSASGGINFGDATANLYRSGFGTLKTDGAFTAAGNLQANQGMFIQTSINNDGKIAVFPGPSVGPSLGSSLSLNALVSGSAFQTFSIYAQGGSVNAVNMSVTDGNGGTHMPIYMTTNSNQPIAFQATGGGNVGIGTTSPPVASLDLWGNLNVGTSSTPTLFVNTATRFVGIGTNNPARPLDVLDTTSGNNPVARFEYGAGSGQIEILGASASGANINFGAVGGTTNLGAVAYNNSTNALSFRTNSVSNRMVIDSNGNLGIGTTNPISLLNIEGPNTVAFTQVAQFDAGNAGGAPAGAYIGIGPASASLRNDGARIYGGRWTDNRGVRIAQVPRLELR